MASHFSCLPDISSGSPCSRCKPRGAGLRGDGKSDSGIVTISLSFPTGERGEHALLPLAILAGVGLPWYLLGGGGGGYFGGGAEHSGC